MSDSDPSARTPASRPRPTYGLPAGDATAADDATHGSATAAQSSAQTGSSAEPTRTQPAANAYDSSTPGSPLETPRRKRGLVPLIIGAVLMFVLAPILVITAVAIPIRAVWSDFDNGPQAVALPQGEYDLAEWDVIMLYVPAESSATSCEVTSSNPTGLVFEQSEGTSPPIVMGDGQAWREIGAAASTEDVTIQIECDGADTVGILGPYSSVTKGLIPVGLGLLGIGSALAGLTLIVVGLVLYMRYRRSANNS